MLCISFATGYVENDENESTRGIGLRQGSNNQELLNVVMERVLQAKNRPFLELLKDTFVNEVKEEVVLPEVLLSAVPSDVPSSIPSDIPSLAPSDVPSIVPSDIPSLAPSDVPSTTPIGTKSVKKTKEVKRRRV